MATTRYVKIVDGAIVKSRNIDNSKLPLETALDGSGNPYWRPYVTETIDNSTGPETKSSSVETIEPTQVKRTTTIVDKTQLEIDAELDAIVDQWDTASRDQLYALAKYVRTLTSYTYELTNIVRANNGDGALSVIQFGNQLTASNSSISMAEFKSKVKEELS